MNPLIIAILILVAALLALLFFYCELKTRHRHLRNYAVTRLQLLINHGISYGPDADKGRAELLDALNSTPARSPSPIGYVPDAKNDCPLPPPKRL